MKYEFTDIRKSPIASRMDFKKLPVITRYPGYISVEWLYWMVEVFW